MPRSNAFQLQAQLDRRLCQRSLYYLCKEVLGYKDMVPHVHGDLTHFATAPEYGRFRQATMPRSWFKTWVWTIGKAIWMTLPDEEGIYTDLFPYKGCNVRILIASNVIDNAAKMIFKIKQEWMSNDRLRAAFPELIPDFNKTRWSDHVAQVQRDLKATEGTYTAVGVGGSVISQHFDHIIEDDLIYARKDDFTGMELMPSQEDIDNAIGWHKLAFSLLADPNTGSIDCIGTRWAPQDIIHYIRRYEPQYACMEIAVTRGAEWPIEDNSSCIWPERYSKTALEQIAQAQGPRIFETQYLNRPRATSDIIFRKEYVNVHDYIAEYPQGIVYKTVVDLAGWGDSRGTCRNVIVTGGKCSKNHVWISRCDVGRLNPTEVIDKFKSHSKQFNSWVHIEEVQYQRSVRHFAREQMERDGEVYHIEQLPFDGRRNAKELRIMSVEPIVSNGMLHITRSMKDLIEELEYYPNYKTCDILDCLGYLIHITKPIETPYVPPIYDPFKMENIEQELKRKGRSMVGYPFGSQINKWMGVGRG